MIFDNVMVACETIHSMKQKHYGKSENMALKLDMSKAYDRVEWSYLEGIMKNFGFSNRWISLIMNRVSSVTYLVMVNGNQCGHIKPTRGIRQGDPLSPYLFLLCVEGLASMLDKAKSSRKMSHPKFGSVIS